MINHADFITPLFLLVLIFLEFIMIAYFSYSALTTITQNSVIQLTGTDSSCVYDNLPTLTSADLCTGTANYFNTTPDGVIYQLGTNVSSYQQVCRSYCPGGVDKTGACITPNSNYTNCVSDLENTSGCKDSAKPLAEIGGVYYYASKIGC
jgi:hypothetical protein